MQFIAALLLASTAAAHIPGEVLVGLDHAPTESERSALGATSLHRLGHTDAYRITLDGESVEAAVARLEQLPGVRYAEPNYIVKPRVLPSDYLFGEQWALYNLGQGQGGGWPAGIDVRATTAWSITTGSSDVLVAVLDTGVDYSHEDLAGNIWSNPGEIAGNGVDDDGNGYIDDVVGWDFVDEDASPYDGEGHGTHVAGIIGAVGDNGIGIAGVSWDVSLMAVRMIGDDANPGGVDDAAEAVIYAVDNGARIINCSWGFDEEYSQTLDDAFAYAAAHDVLMVTAAGNDAKNVGLEAVEDYPAELPYDNILNVGATARDGWLAWFSNFGDDAVDITAPGGPLIVSSVPYTTGMGKYDRMYGTSMAAPHVSGVAALLLSIDPGLTSERMKQILIDTVEPYGEDRAVLSDGWVDAREALEVTLGDDRPPIARVNTIDVAHIGHRVSLTAAASSDPNGETVQPTWLLLKPDGSGTALESDDTIETSFVADVCGEYEVGLQVADSKASSEVVWQKVFVGLSEPSDIETVHPVYYTYEDDWAVTREGARSLTLTIEGLDSWYSTDFLSVWKGNTLLEMHSGKKSRFRIRTVEGDSLALNFYTPRETPRYGFKADSVYWCDDTCAPGFGDCDGDASNGCEIDLTTSLEHYGVCNEPYEDPGPSPTPTPGGGDGHGGNGGGPGCTCSMTPGQSAPTPLAAVGLLLAALAGLTVRRQRRD